MNVIVVSLSLPAKTFIYNPKDGVVYEVGSLLDTFTAIKTSGIGVGIFGLRATRTSKSTTGKPEDYNLSFTISGFHLRDFTERCVPPIVNNANVLSIKVTPSSQVGHLLASSFEGLNVEDTDPLEEDQDFAAKPTTVSNEHKSSKNGKKNK